MFLLIFASVLKNLIDCLYLGKYQEKRNIGAFERKSPNGFSHYYPVFLYCIKARQG